MLQGSDNTMHGCRATLLDLRQQLRELAATEASSTAMLVSMLQCMCCWQSTLSPVSAAWGGWVQEEAKGSALSGSLKSCIIYRAAQKRLARLYLGAARAALFQEMQALQLSSKLLEQEHHFEHAH